MKKKRNVKFILLSLLIFYIFIFSDIGIISKIGLDKKLKNYANQIEQIQNENEILKMQIDRLNKDYNYIAEQARKVGYARPGEKIYRFYQNEAQTNQEKQTNKIISSETKFKVRDYLIYIITFIVVLAIYIILIITTK